jgi:hypothetical protein
MIPAKCIAPRSSRTAVLLVLLGLAFGWAGLARAEDHKDPKAVELAHAMMQAMGGENGWNSAHFVRFDFDVTKGGKTLVDRKHLWDKFTGRYRLETKTKDGKSEVVLFNTGTKDGSVYVDGKKLEGAEAKKALDDAYGAFINDMYWLAEPWKWLDPGVNLKYLGEKKLGGKPFDEVELTFGHVGLTPGDKYHAYVSRDSHLMTHWEYKLQGGQTGNWNWQYAETGGIKLAKNHVSADGKTQINMGDVLVLEHADDTFFTDPTYGLAALK